jgi:RimJ/RimL family protein N-acetyltransferase
MNEADLFIGKLVRLTAEDPETMAKPYSEWARDTEYSRYLDSNPPYTFSTKKWKEWLEKDVEKTDNNFFNIRTLEDNQLIGFVGLFELYCQHGDAMVAIAIGPHEYWGKGYGTDAMNLILRFAFTELNLRRMSLIVFEYNQRGIRSYEKNGFKIEGRVRGAMLREGKRCDFIWMGVMREEWLQIQEQAEAALEKSSQPALAMQGGSNSWRRA